MKKMFINLVIDESSSMGSSRRETISGFNEYIDEQKKNKDVDILVSLTKFSSTSNQVFTAKPIADVEPLTEETYAPNGSTALYDAVAQSIHQTEVALQREKDDVSVLTVVFSDGEENASVEYRDSAKIRKLIKDKEAKGTWTFVFFGTDIDAWTAGTGLGVSAANVMKVARGKTSDMYKALSNSTNLRAKSVAKCESVDHHFFAANMADYADIDKEDDLAKQLQARTSPPMPKGDQL